MGKWVAQFHAGRNLAISVEPRKRFPARQAVKQEVQRQFRHVIQGFLFFRGAEDGLRFFSGGSLPVSMLISMAFSGAH
jgi:hypothetical protein